MAASPLSAHHLLTLAVGAGAGYLAFAIGAPLPWMLGPMIATTLLATAGVRVEVPRWLPLISVPIVGTMLGSRMTAEVLSGAATWATTIAFVPVYAAVSATISMYFYRRFGGFDRVTAYYSAMPGGLHDMMIMGAEAGGDERRIALAHASRILCVIAFVAMFFGVALGVRSNGGVQDWTGFGALGPIDAALLIGAAVLGVPFGKLLRLPAAQMVGPMILSSALHLPGIVELPPPSLLVILAQIVLGARVGSRFSGVSLRRIGTDIGLGAVSSLLMIGVALGTAAAVSRVTGVDMLQAFLAFAPGGLIEMSLLALAMGQQAAFVSVIHIARIMVVIFGAPLVFRHTDTARKGS